MSKKLICVIDGQGGGIGSRLLGVMPPEIKEQHEVFAVGTNVNATSSMLRAGARKGATGDNALIYNCERAEFVLGPIGMIVGNGLMGEVSYTVASHISGSRAQKILIPSNSCHVVMAGVEQKPMEAYIQDAISILRKALDSTNE